MKDDAQHVANTILKIYAGFKWKLKIAYRTPEDVNKLIDEAIAEIKTLIHPSYQLDVIQKFEQMRNRLSEFTVDGKFELPPTVTASSGAQQHEPTELKPPRKCKCGHGNLLMMKQGDNADTERFSVRCEKCGKTGLSSENPHIALENWNNGMVD